LRRRPEQPSPRPGLPAAAQQYTAWHCTQATGWTEAASRPREPCSSGPPACWLDRRGSAAQVGSRARAQAPNLPAPRARAALGRRGGEHGGRNPSDGLSACGLHPCASRLYGPRMTSHRGGRRAQTAWSMARQRPRAAHTPTLHVSPRQRTGQERLSHAQGPRLACSLAVALRSHFAKSSRALGGTPGSTPREVREAAMASR